MRTRSFKPTLLGLLFVCLFQLSSFGQDCQPPMPSFTCQDACTWCESDLFSNYFDNYDAPVSNLQNFGCGVIHNPKWFKLLADADQIELGISVFDCQLNKGLQAALYEVVPGVDCNNLNHLVSCIDQILWNANLVAPTTPGQEYLLMIDGYNYDRCSFQFDNAYGIKCKPEDGQSLVKVNILESNINCTLPTDPLFIQGANWTVRFYNPLTNALIKTFTGGNLGQIITDLSDSVDYMVKLQGPDNAMMICSDSIYLPAHINTAVFKVKPLRKWEPCVYEDLNGNCQLDVQENLIAGTKWQFNVTSLATGQSAQYVDDPGNGYLLLAPPPGEYSISVTPPSAAWKICPDFQTVHLDFIDTVRTCFGAQTTDNCVDPSVDIAQGRLRKGRPTTVLVSYCNNSALPHTNVQLSVTLDPMLFYDTASVNPVGANGHTLNFLIPSVDAFACKSIFIQAMVSDSVQFGQTLCSDVQASYHSDCVQSGLSPYLAYITVKGVCEQDSVVFTIQNQFPASQPSSLLSYLVFKNGAPQFPSRPIDLDASGKMEVKLPADGSSWHLEAEQESEQDYHFLPAASVEACSSDPNAISGLGAAASLPPNSGLLYDQDCDPVQTPLDPNVKTGIPTGITSKHYIKAGSDIEYRIEFENTGTDTAFNVVVYDTLPKFLNPNTTKPGSASAPFSFARFNGGILRWTFQGINLPPKSTDPEHCRGWFTFRAPQKPQNLPGTVIRNKAWIYFDLEAPVSTNTYEHNLPAPALVRYDSTIYVCSGTQEYIDVDGMVYPVPVLIVKNLELAQFSLQERYKILSRPQISKILNKKICQGGFYLFLGDTLTSAGQYKKHLPASNGCDSMIVLNLTLNPPPVVHINRQICEGDYYVFKGDTLSQAGIYEKHFNTYSGCDSVVSLNLSIKAPLSIHSDATICAGGFYLFHGQRLTLPGTYEAVIPASTGCDTLFSLNLQVFEPQTSLIEAAVCTGEVYTYNNQPITQEGQYSWIFADVHGCDSTVILKLEHLPVSYANITQFICRGDTVSFNGESLTESGLYVSHLQNLEGCDSLLQLQLIVRDTSLTFIQVETTPGGQVNGVAVYQDTIIYLQQVAQNGCDSTLVFQVHVLSSTGAAPGNLVQFRIFPNPAFDYATWTLQNVASGRLYLVLFNALGQKVLEQRTVLYGGNGIGALDLKALSAGVYQLAVWLESEQIQHAKLIITR